VEANKGARGVTAMPGPFFFSSNCGRQRVSSSQPSVYPSLPVKASDCRMLPSTYGCCVPSPPSLAGRAWSGMRGFLLCTLELTRVAKGGCGAIPVYRVRLKVKGMPEGGSFAGYLPAVSVLSPCHPAIQGIALAWNGLGTRDVKSLPWPPPSAPAGP
jgi:hypothetical protein